MSIGRVFNRAFSTLGGNPVTVFGISFVFGALPSLLLNYGTRNLGYTQQGFATGAISPAIFFGTTIVTALLTLFFSMLTQGALVRTTAAFSEGRNASFGESAMAGVRAAVPLFLLGILMGLGLALGFVLLIVPGIILYLMWAVAAPALVEERTGVFGAFDRSSFLTKGARWKIFALGLIMMLIYWLFAAAIGLILVAIYGVQGLADSMRQGPSIAWVLVSGVMSTILTAILTTIHTSLYVELRNWKDGPASEKLADIFA
ncbi:hypothetical protein GCM10009087_38410 [Sphingomonas oligophenolica]